MLSSPKASYSPSILVHQRPSLTSLSFFFFFLYQLPDTENKLISLEVRLSDNVENVHKWTSTYLCLAAAGLSLWCILQR